MIGRRRLLQSCATIGTASLLQPAYGSISSSERKMIFVRVPGGWDTTRVFSPVFDNPNVSMESEAQETFAGDLRFVDHPDRPQINTFFSEFSQQTVILNGLIIPSINHLICERLLYSANSSGTVPDWATQIAAAKRDKYPLPHVLISGKAIGGKQNDLIVRVGNNGQLEKLLSGNLDIFSDTEVILPPSTHTDISNAYLQQMLQHQANADRFPSFMNTYNQSIDRSILMKELSADIRWNTDGSEASQIDLTVDLLLSDLTRCITLEFYRLTFDSHESNDSKQSQNFADLFSFLHLLTSTLSTTPGLVYDTLLEECTIVVLSEMGRTPHQNTAKGKDHWCHTAGMLIGSGIKGGRNYGGYSEYFYGQPIDLNTAEVTSSGKEITPRIFGATLLALADVDPVSLGVDPIFGILE